MWNNWTASTARAPSVDDMLAMMRKLDAKKKFTEAGARLDLHCERCRRCGHSVKLSDDGGTVTVCEHQLDSLRKLPKTDSLASNTYLPPWYGIRVEIVEGKGQANNGGNG